MEFIIVGLIIVGVLISLIPERRSIWFGALSFDWFLAFYTIVFITVTRYLEIEAGSLGDFIAMGFLFLPFLAILLLPIWGTLFLLVSGVRLIQREGFRFTNLLALGLGIALVVYLFFNPLLQVTESNVWLVGLMRVLIATGIFFAVELVMYFLTTFANSVHMRRYKFDHIIVLGAGLIGEKVTPLLASRINRGIAIWKKQEKPCYLIMSGGQGADEVISEAEAMKRYAVEQGVPEEWIIMEDQSMNTEQNLQNSYGIIKERCPESNHRAAIVTNYFHIFRAVVLARKMGYKCVGYGARTKLYYSLNAFIRDFIGYVALTWKKQLLVLVLFLLVINFFTIIEYVNNFVIQAAL